MNGSPCGLAVCDKNDLGMFGHHSVRNTCVRVGWLAGCAKRLQCVPDGQIVSLHQRVAVGQDHHHLCVQHIAIGKGHHRLCACNALLLANVIQLHAPLLARPPAMRARREGKVEREGESVCVAKLHTKSLQRTVQPLQEKHDGRCVCWNACASQATVVFLPRQPREKRGVDSIGCTHRVRLSNLRRASATGKAVFVSCVPKTHSGIQQCGHEQASQ
jgi:hypothetical protein